MTETTRRWNISILVTGLIFLGAGVMALDSDQLMAALWLALGVVVLIGQPNLSEDQDKPIWRWRPRNLLAAVLMVAVSAAVIFRVGLRLAG